MSELLTKRLDLVAGYALLQTRTNFLGQAFHYGGTERWSKRESKLRFDAPLHWCKSRFAAEASYLWTVSNLRLRFPVLEHSAEIFIGA